MTKYMMVKKFMKENNCDKNTAQEFLRTSKWNYDDALISYNIQKNNRYIKEAFESINWDILGESIRKAFDDVIKAIRTLEGGNEDVRNSDQIIK